MYIKIVSSDERVVDVYECQRYKIVTNKDGRFILVDDESVWNLASLDCVVFVMNNNGKTIDTFS